MKLGAHGAIKRNGCGGSDDKQNTPDSPRRMADPAAEAMAEK